MPAYGMGKKATILPHLHYLLMWWREKGTNTSELFLFRPENGVWEGP